MLKAVRKYTGRQEVEHTTKESGFMHYFDLRQDDSRRHLEDLELSDPLQHIDASASQ